MKVVNTGNRYVIYDDSLKTFDKIPAGTYVVCFEKNSGFFLRSKPDMQINETVYGQHTDKINKVMSSFERFSRHLGIILSGDKGIGKSMFARMLSVECIRKDIPVIIVDSFIQNIAAYIESIDQEVMILFDEFDKTFAKCGSDGEDPQATMLSLFDGTSNGKKMFVVTCNSLNMLNDFLVNRPGRFHYHLRFEYPTAADIRVYLQDKIPEEYYDQIDSVISFSRKVDLNYDCLRAIAFELSSGIPFAEAIQDLNIINLNQETYKVFLHFGNGEKAQSYGTRRIDLFDPEGQEDVTLYYGNDCGIEIGMVSFNTCDSKYDAGTNSIIVPADALEINWEKYNDTDDKEEREVVSRLQAAKPIYLSLVRKTSKSIHYAV